MRRFNTVFLSRWLRNIMIVVLAGVPFHALLTVWLSSIFGHYTAFRLWKEALLVVLLLGVLVLVARRRDARKLANVSILRVLLLLISAYVALQLLAGLIALAADRVTATALGYAYVSNLRFVLFLLVGVVVGYVRKDWLSEHWRKLLLGPAVVVVGFGLLQFLVLPADFLKHVGYGADTIAPYIAVDQKPEYARVQSVTRGPNPLGAYLVITITTLVALCLTRTREKKAYVFLFVAAFVLIGTYSRSAWLGMFLALLLLVWLLIAPHWRRVLAIAAAVFVVGAAGSVFAFRDNDLVQNVVFHTDETSQADRSSNEDRTTALTGGLRDVVNEPLGRGPGTAGPASNYNGGETRLAENYFLQVGQEVGVLGMGLFMGICGVVALALWRIRSVGILPLVLLACFAGLTLVNLLSHAWADDTLAYVWWGFAGLTIGAYTLTETKQVKKTRAKKTV